MKRIDRDQKEHKKGPPEVFQYLKVSDSNSDCQRLITVSPIERDLSLS